LKANLSFFKWEFRISCWSSTYYQTENNNPITPKEDKAKVYNIPKLKSDKTSPWPKGITAH